MNGKHNLRERGQAMMEYAVLFPMAVGILIVAGSIGYTNRMMYAEIVNAFVQPGIEETCEPIDEGPTVVEMEGHRIELCGAVYNEASDVTTITYCVETATNADMCHWTLGVDRHFANSIISVTGEDTWGWTDGDSTTGTSGVQFGEGNRGQCQPKGNNGVGNGEDPQPPGEPPVNDGEGTGPGNPGNRGGADPSDGNNGNDNPKGNNGVGNGEDPQPPGEPPVNDGEGTGPGNPGNRGGADPSDGNNGNGGNNPGNGGGRGNASLPSTSDRATMKSLNLGNMNLNDDVWNYNGTANDILILATGKWDANEGTVTVYDGTSVQTRTITLPVQVTDNCEE